MRPEKQLLMDEIDQKLKGASAFVLTSYQDLNPNLSSQLRIEVAKKGSQFAVVKKRLFAKAANISVGTLSGHIGVLFVESPEVVGALKTLCDFKKQNETAFEVIGGWVEGRVVSASDVLAISKLPTQDEMRAQFLGLLEAPMSQTLSVVESLLSSVMHCLENKSKL